jgi:acetoacetyl-CoA synthetase
MDVADGAVIYQPGREAIERSRVGKYMAWLADERDLHFEDYQSLWQWSVDDIDAFWRSIWDYFEVESSTPLGEVLGRREMPGAEWFPGTRINYTGEYLRAARGRDDEVAVIGESQTRDQVTYTHGQLIDLISRIRTGLERLGVEQGDRVVAYMPNLPETVAAWLAVASMGAIWASAAPEFGPRAVIDRFGQLDPKVLLVVDGYRYGDKDIDVRNRVAEIRSAIPSLEHTVGLTYNGRQIDDALAWEQLTADSGPLDIVPVPFAHPLCVLFSSGTTGLPKPIVHGHGGIMLEAYKNQGLSWDLGRGDRLLWFSTTAWMMWNAIVNALLTGASIVCIDGNPTWPDMNMQWRLVERTQATMMGLGPAFIMACVKAGMSPAAEFDLSSLRMLSAGGSPLPTEGFVWVYEQFGDRAPLYVGSGGTDICTAVVQGCPIVPVYAGEISSKMLGVAAYAYDEHGNEVIDELGELVITEPMPSMPVRFWGDDDLSRYESAYFKQYPGVMRFGDWVRFSDHGTSVIAGRSDATLNRGGVRIGTAEIYRVVEQLPEVTECLAIHLEDPLGGMGDLILFVQTGDRALDEDLERTVRDSIRNALSPRHVPDHIFGVSGIPRTLTGKKLELPIKKLLRGVPMDQVISRQALANPGSLDQYLAIREARLGSPEVAS